jgi:hypothetical protein
MKKFNLLTHARTYMHTMQAEQYTKLKCNYQNEQSLRGLLQWHIFNLKIFKHVHQLVVAFVDLYFDTRL